MTDFNIKEKTLRRLVKVYKTFKNDPYFFNDQI